jgi:hypothetical protein
MPNPAPASSKIRTSAAPAGPGGRLSSGSMTDLQVAAGDFLNNPTAAAMTIANLDTVWVTARCADYVSNRRKTRWAVPPWRREFGRSRKSAAGKNRYPGAALPAARW